MDEVPLLDSGRLQQFEAVARERGFSRAARRLGRSQSSVSEAVAALEEELGVRLFVRGAREVWPTESGLALWEHVRRLARETAQVREALAELDAGQTGRLTVGTSDTLACHLLPPVLSELRRRHPGVELTLFNRPSPAIAAAVADGSLDLGVISGPLPPLRSTPGRRVAFEPLCPQREVLLCPPGHPLATRRRITLEALAAHPLMLLDRTTGARAHLESAFQARGVVPRVAMEMGSVEVLKRLVTLGFGCAIVPELALADAGRRPPWAVVELVGFTSERWVALARAEPAPTSRAAAAFVAIARERLAGALPPRHPVQRRPRPKPGAKAPDAP